MPTPQILYLSPRLRGAMTERQADALSYIARRLDRAAQPVSLAGPGASIIAFPKRDGWTPPGGASAPAIPPAYIVTTAVAASEGMRA